MSEPEKPFHVRVAEALGTLRVEDGEPAHETYDHDGDKVCSFCGGYAPSWDDNVPGPCAPHYDIDWAATGPLIEKYHVSLEFIPSRPDLAERWPAGFWSAQTAGVSCSADAPLKAVCECLILYHDIRSTIDGAA